jgi:hypothetical protein
MAATCGWTFIGPAQVIVHLARPSEMFEGRGAKAWAEYEAKSRAIAKNMERLRALRLAKEADPRISWLAPLTHPDRIVAVDCPSARVFETERSVLRGFHGPPTRHSEPTAPPNGDRRAHFPGRA